MPATDPAPPDARRAPAPVPPGWGPRSLALLALAAALATAGCVGGPPASAGGADGGAGPPASGASGPSTYDPGWPPLEDARLRPGVTVGWGCTSSFLFRSPDNRSLYLGTSAYCLSGTRPGETVPVAGDHNGTLVYSSFAAQHRDDGTVENPADNFALVELPEVVRGEVHPAVLREGGPTGVAGAAVGDEVRVYGNSSFRPGGGATGPRRGVVTDAGDWSLDLYAAGPDLYTASGGPVLTPDGQAVGVLGRQEVAPQAGSHDAALLEAVLGAANDRSPLTFELVTWRALDDPLPAASP